jgi:YVTN family beta-propeller protein
MGVRQPLIFVFLLATGLASTPASGESRLFVADMEGNAVTEIDPGANRVVATIPVSGEPEGLALWTDVDSTKASRLYVSTTGKNLLGAIDLRTRKIVGTVAVGPKPGCVALSPDGRRVFVCSESQPGIDVVDTAGMQKLRMISLAGEWGGSPHNLYITPDLTRMIAAGDRKLTVINVRSEKLEYRIDVDGVVQAMAIQSDKNLVIHRLFVSVAGQKGLEVFDYASRKMTGKVALPGAATGLRVSPDRKTLWVSTASTDSVTAFSLADLKAVATISVDRGPGEIVCSAELNRCFVACAGGSVTVLDSAGLKEVRRIPAGKSPGRLVFGE